VNTPESCNGAKYGDIKTALMNKSVEQLADGVLQKLDQLLVALEYC